MATLMVVLVVICTIFPCSLAESRGVTDYSVLRRPDLGIYQDIGKCAHPGSTWYVLYRNTEEGGFGPNDRCLRDAQISEVADGNARFRFRYGSGQERNATFTFKSSEGQTGKNIVKIQLDGAPKAALYDLLFVDCEYCKVMKSQTGERCVFSVTEASLRHGVPQHCQFLYDLFCGAVPRYQISDASCLAHDMKRG